MYSLSINLFLLANKEEDKFGLLLINFSNLISIPSLVKKKFCEKGPNTLQLAWIANDLIRVKSGLELISVLPGQ